MTPNSDSGFGIQCKMYCDVAFHCALLIAKFAFYIVMDPSLIIAYFSFYIAPVVLVFNATGIMQIEQ